MDEIRKIPPVTRTIIIAIIAVSISPLLELANPYLFLLWWEAILKKQQFWRVFTPFFLSPGGIPFIFNLFFIGKNSFDLEMNHFMRRTSDYVWALLIIGTLIHITNAPLGSTVLFHPLMAAVTYLWSRANSTSQVSLFGLISCPAILLPYAYLVFDLLQGGLSLLIRSCTGILSAHIYWYFAEILPATNERNPRRYLATPAFMTRLFPDSTDPSNAATSQATGGQTAGGGGRVQRTGWGGTAFAPRGSTIGGGSSSQTPSGPAAALGASTANASRSWSSYLPFGGGGSQSGSSTASSSSSSKEAQRRAMLEATEKRLRNSYQNSIAGSHARAMKNGGGSSSATVGSAGSGSDTTSSSGVNVPQVNQAIRSRKPAGGSSSFSTMGKKGGDEDEEDEELLNPSGSGGSVAEDRSHLSSGSKPKAPDSQDKADSGDHSWGSGGQRLGE